MTTNIHNPSFLSSLNTIDLAAYLRLQGWKEEGKWGDKASVWIREEQEGEVLLPLTRDIGDFVLRMGDIIHTLSRLEQRPEVQVLNDLVLTSADVLRIRLHADSSSHTGTISLEDADLAIHNTREMMIAAACATIEPRGYYSSKKFTQAYDFVKKLRMAQTEQGSYIMKVISRVAPGLSQGEPDGLTPPPTKEPFERQVMYTLMSGLSALSEAAVEAGLRGNMEPFNRSVPKGVSANLCDALLGLAGSNQETSFEFTVSWAKTRLVPKQIPLSVKFLSDTLPVIEEASRGFKETSPQDEFELEGVVIKLTREAASGPGNVTILGAIEDKLRRVSAQIDEKNYHLAIPAHQSHSLIRVRGELYKSGNLWILRNTRHFQVLTSEE